MVHMPEKSKYVHNVCLIADELIGHSYVRYVFEFGSRYGEDSIQFAKKYPDATVFCFECNPNTKDACSENVSKYSNVIFSENAISDSVGDAVFYAIDSAKTRTTWIDGNQGASSLFQASGMYPVEEYSQFPVTVKTTTLKTVMELYEVPRIDILWMDVQGAELLALAGLQERISDVRIVFLEVEFVEIYKQQPLFEDVRKKLEMSGFCFAGFLAVGEFSGDALFLNGSLAPEGVDLSRFGVMKSARPKSRGLRRVLSVKKWLKQIVMGG